MLWSSTIMSFSRSSLMVISSRPIRWLETGQDSHRMPTMFSIFREVMVKP